MEIARLILEYIKALIWPITVLTLSFLSKRNKARVRQTEKSSTAGRDIGRSSRGSSRGQRTIRKGGICSSTCGPQESARYSQDRAERTDDTAWAQTFS